MPARLVHRDRQKESPRHLPALFVGLLVLTSCSLPEGPEWPPESDAATVAAATTEWRALHDDRIPDRPSLATLVGGEPAPPRQGAVELVGRKRPLAVVRFGAARPDFAPALYDALRRALALRPASTFALVGVAPDAGTGGAVPITTDLRQVYQALLELGLPADRLSLSTIALEGVAANEVHLYIL